MFGQVINAMVTPFNSHDEIDYEEVKKLLEMAKENQNDALVIGSTTGEGSSLSMREKKELYLFCKEHCELPLLYALCHNSLTHLKEELDYIQDLNIDGFLIVTPYYVNPPQNGLFLYFKTIAKQIDKPIILYNVPSRSKVTLQFNTIKKLIKSFPNIIGLKEASADFNLINLLKKTFPNFKVYTGDDHYLFECLKNHGDGIISVASIIYGKEYQQLITDYKCGFHNVVLDDYLKLVADLMSIEVNPIPIKALLERYNFKSMNLRLPLIKLSKEQREKFDMLF